MKVFFKSFFLFSLFIFSTILVPMNPPVKEQFKDNLFKVLPPDLFLQRFVIQSEPQVKNLLSKTNHQFNQLLSCKQIQPFMFCRELNVCEIDFLKVFFKDAFNQQDNAINILQERYSIKDRESVFSYCCVKTVDILRNQGTVSHLLLDKNNAQRTLESFQFNPFFVACLFSKTKSIEECIADIGQKDAKSLLLIREDGLIHEDGLKILLYAIIRNNHQNAFEFLLTDQSTREKIQNISEELIQLIVYYARPNFVSAIYNLYKKKLKSDFAKNCQSLPAIVDYIGRWLLKDEESLAYTGQACTGEKPSITDKNSILYIIKSHNEALLKRNNPADHISCCEIILGKNYKKLNKTKKTETCLTKKTETCLLQ